MANYVMDRLEYVGKKIVDIVTLPITLPITLVTNAFKTLNIYTPKWMNTIAASVDKLFGMVGDVAEGTGNFVENFGKKPIKTMDAATNLLNAVDKVTTPGVSVKLNLNRNQKYQDLKNSVTGGTQNPVLQQKK